MIRKLLTALMVSAVFLIASCTDGTLKTSSRTSRPDPSWVTAISLHSNGAISRHSPIRVLFTSDVIAAERVGADASGNIRIQPEVKARAVFASRREIVLRPDSTFAPGTAYRIQVLAQGLTGLSADAKPFEFEVTTLGVNFDVRTFGLDVEYERNELMTLRGGVMTADSEKRELVEKIVKATLDGKPVAVTWEAGERQYDFSFHDIVRKKQEQELVVSWDGAPLGLKTTGSQSWRIPALDEFAVTQTQAVEVNDQRQIQVRFSDALNARQDLKGLVRLSKGEFTTSIDRNLLTLYVNQDLSGEVTLTLEPGIRSRSSQPLIGEREFKLEFLSTKPQVRFIGRGVILPDAQTLLRSVRGGERARRARDRAAGFRVEHSAVPAGERARRHARARPRGSRAVAQDHPAGLARARTLDALRPGRHRADAQTPRRPVPAEPVADASRRAL